MQLLTPSIEMNNTEEYNLLTKKNWYSTIIACEIREKQLSDGNQWQWRMLDLSLVQYPTCAKLEKNIVLQFYLWSRSHFPPVFVPDHNQIGRPQFGLDMKYAKKESLPGIFPIVGLNHMLHSE